MGGSAEKSIKITEKQKKYIVSLFLVIAVAILMITFQGFGSQKEVLEINNIKNTEPATKKNFFSNLIEIEEHMEKRLVEIISQIDGVGQVAINITLENSLEYEYAMNTNNDQKIINEEAQDGSTRTTNEIKAEAKVVMKSLIQGENEPVIIKEQRPEVVGVMVVAEGAENIILREKISRGVQTVLNIPAHRVMVLPKGGQEKK